MAKSVFEQIKKQNGERFAKAIRGYDNGIFDIPGIVDIVKYAGHEAEPIMDYLESLKEIHIEETGVYQDPLILLDAAGYDAYYVTNLEEQNAIRKYYAPGEELCTFRDPHRFENYHIINAVRKDVNQIRREDFRGREEREDEYGTSVLSIQILKEGGFISIKNRYNHTVNNPDNTLNSNPDNIIPGLSNALRHHFQTDFSAQRVQLPPNFTIVNNQIVHYNYERDNTYFGTNFYIEDGEIHQLKDHEIMLDSHIFDLKSKKLIYPPNHEMEIEPYFTDFEGNKFYTGITSVSDSTYEEDTEFKKALLKEIEGHKVILKKDKDGQHLFIRQEGEKDPAKDIEILTVKDGCITALNLPTTTEIGNNFLSGNQTIRKLSLPQVKSVGYDFLRHNTVLEELDAPLLEQAEDNFLENNIGIKTLRLPNLKNVGNGFLFRNTDLKEFDAPLLRDTGGCFLASVNRLKSLKLPSLIYTGPDFLHFNTDLEEFDAPLLEWTGKDFLGMNKGLKTLCLPNLKSVGNDFLSSNTDLEEFNAPLLEKAEDKFLRENRGLKTLHLPKLKSVGHAFLFENSSLEEFNASLLEKSGESFLHENRGLKTLYLPNLKSVGSGFLFHDTDLEEFEAPLLEQVGNSFLTHNKGLKTLRLPHLKSVSYNFLLYNTDLEEFDAPLLKQVGGCFLRDNRMLRILNLPNLRRIDDHFLGNNTLLEQFYAPHLSEEISDSFWDHPNRESLWAHRMDGPKTGMSAQLKPAANMGQGATPVEKSAEPSDEQDAATLKHLRDKLLPQK